MDPCGSNVCCSRVNCTYKSTSLILRTHIQATPLNSSGITFWNRHIEDSKPPDILTNHKYTHPQTPHEYTPQMLRHTQNRKTPTTSAVLLIYIHNSHTPMDTHMQIFPSPEHTDPLPNTIHYATSPEYKLPTTTPTYNLYMCGCFYIYIFLPSPRIYRQTTSYSYQTHV